MNAMVRVGPPQRGGRPEHTAVAVAVPGWWGEHVDKSGAQIHRTQSQLNIANTPQKR
jgi:hypothetical protein